MSGAGASHPPWARIAAWLDGALELEPAGLEPWLAERLRAGDLDEVGVHALRSLLADRTRLESEGFMQHAAAPPDWREGTAAPPVELQAGQRLGAYRLVRPLGQGGMGQVWLAERADGLFQRPVALKLPHAGLPGGLLAERLARERRILAALDHPHIARLYDAGVTPEGRPFLALEFVDGVPLKQACDARQLGVNERLRLMVEVLQAVAHAHARLVVHRDLKPNNILLGADGRVTLLDFGIAKLLSEPDGDAEASVLTRLGGRAVTPAYASPEQIAGAPIGVASDVYSAGVVLYELLCGHRPYEPARDSVAALEEAILQGDPPPPGAVVDEVAAARCGMALPALRRRLRGDLDTVVLKALARVPETRYPSAQAFADDLQRHLDGLPVQARPAPPLERLLKLVRRRRVESAIAAVAIVALVGGAWAQIAVALALAAGGALALWQARRARHEAQRSRAQAERAARESRHAQAALDFVLDLLRANRITQGDPAAARATTAEALLRAGAARVGAALADVPEVQERVLDALAAMHFEIGLADDAARLRRQRIEVLRRIAGPDDLRIAEALLNLAIDSADTRTRADTAIALAEVQHMLDRAGDHDSVLRARLWIEQARFHAFDRPARSGWCAEQALRTLGERDDDEGFRRDALRLAAKSCLALNDLEAAARWNQAALDEVARRYPAAPIWRVAPLGEQGDVRQALLDHAGAEASLREAYAIARQVCGPGHADTAHLGNRLAALLHATGRRDEAHRLLAESAAALAAQGAGASAVPAAVQGALSVLLLAEGRLDEVEPGLLADIDDLRANYPGAVLLARRLAALGDLRRRQGRLAEAAAALAEAGAIWHTALDDAHPSCFNALRLSEGAFALAQGDAAAALRAFDAVQPPPALQAWRCVPEVLQARCGRAQALACLGRRDEARRDLAELLERVRGDPGRDRLRALEDEAQSIAASL
ncbi:MAG: serine/threonine-protein kinase [Rubrivivax sp.]